MPVKQKPDWIRTEDALAFLKERYNVTLTKPTFYKLIKKHEIYKQPNGKWGHYLVDKHGLEAIYD